MIKKEYNDLLSSGMFFEFFPQLSGNWIEDELEFKKQYLINFEKHIEDIYSKGYIKGPIHLSSGNEEQLISIFKKIKDTDWVFSTWRSHYHALLHNIPKDGIEKQILEGRSITLCFPEHNFYTSAIVGGVIPIALGAAMSIKLKYQEYEEKLSKNKSIVVNKYNRDIVFDEFKEINYKLDKEWVWCFIGDMSAETGIFHESYKYAVNNNLPITFIIENNEYSVGTPTKEALYSLNKNRYLDGKERLIKYYYKLNKPHSGVGKFIAF